MRQDGRLFDQLRPITINYDSYGYADASVLLELGDTKVFCSISLQPGVPAFLKGTKTGWLKAEYAMLPTATQVRTQRESCSSMRAGRSVEISRLIGRSLRSMLNMSIIGERTVVIDCDVLSADGGTRTACITAASLALCRANERWLAQRLISRSAITERIVGVSVGVLHNGPLLDITFQEDSTVDADFNIVITESKSVIELQGSSERSPVAWATCEAVWQVAQKGAETLFTFFTEKAASDSVSHERVPLFSLSNRINA